MTKEQLLIKFLKNKAKRDKNFNFDKKNMYSGYFKKEELNRKPYLKLYYTNGDPWGRKDGTIGKKYIVEKKYIKGKVDEIRLNGINKDDTSKQIRTDIKEHYKDMPCVILGTTNRTEVDHKNGRKNNPRVKNTNTQNLDDFQPLSKHANTAKRQFCKDCVKTGKRYDAKELGYPISYYKGNEKHDGTENGCEGCFWYDPIEFRKHLIEKK